MSETHPNHQQRLNRMTPATKRVELGTVIEAMITQHNALCAKLDADTGVNNTNYAALLRVAPLSER